MRNLVGPGLALGLALGSGCYAGVESFEGADGGPNGSPGDDGAEDDGADDEGEPASACGADPAPGASPIRRLSAWEYDNTILDLLGDDSHPSAGFPQEGGSGFDNNADVSAVTRLMAQKYLDASEGIATRAVADLGTLLPCDPAAGAGERACIEQWVDGFGLRAWRRPLTADERTAMLGLYDEARAIEDLPTATSLVLQAFLQSPHFLYRVELGIPGEQGTSAVRLGGHEMASRLSYFLWGSMPDDALLDAAAAGGLASADDVEAQARRMLDDPKARRMVEHFHEQWLGTIRLATLEKDTTVFPAWSPELSAKQVQEALAFVDHVFFEGEGTLDELLTAPYTFVDAELAEFYGLPVPAGTGLRKTEAAGEIELSGILSLGGVLSAYALADTTDPIKRGLFVREHLLCQIPPPPPDVIPELPPVDPNATTRERFEQHRADPACAACHTLFDPIGFGFENYDAVGRWRTTENDLPIDASGELTAADVAGEFVGVRELGGKLAASEDVAACVSRQWFRFAYGRLESEALDACNMETLATTFAESGHDLRELLVALTQTDAFMFRTAYADEGGE
jgi:hypothetical protein